MSNFKERLDALSPARLRGVRRGIEKESLRAQPDGKLALTPHPAALGSALTHPHITTDFSESQLELITGAHLSVEAALEELVRVHQYTYRVLDEAGDERLWVSSMPCGLPTDETIPIGRYGSSNVGRAKSVYRMGLSHRYGRRMQTISGIHYNWSLPEVSSEQYFALIRNFRRHAFLLLYLFGASPALCSSFVDGRPHELQPLGEGSMHMPHGTSLRMGRLGYQSEAQASLAVSYNSLDGYGASLQDALTRPWPAYEAIGIRNLGGDYNQLATSLLQIENEFYGTIRPKRVIYPGERPLHALRERGVEYVEVRLMDLDPFEPVGINARTMRFLDVFLLHCLLSDSPPDTREEIADLAHNQHLTAARGREPGLLLRRGGREAALTEWGGELLEEFAPIAEALDAAHGGGTQHADAVRAAAAALGDPAVLPSARVLEAMSRAHNDSFVGFVRARSEQTRTELLALPFPDAQRELFERMTQTSIDAQKRTEASDSMPFEIYREQYVSPARLGFKNHWVDAPAGPVSQRASL
ncbi:glutamate--cysteine ligase [Variovorax saccharolyticus]|uniref:glutamate--cysteine ligase n=1 Tax=Variovorax saccharolyticus TaxID=3053516 RepID=UPI0025786D85|nr:glutamate--cysteine ligase [Variovorax sp. J22R187]MDM0022551.1 glutamate--cysteine ligase [Variovorax sp. J22R187]